MKFTVATNKPFFIAIVIVLIALAFSTFLVIGGQAQAISDVPVFAHGLTQEGLEGPVGTVEAKGVAVGACAGSCPCGHTHVNCSTDSKGDTSCDTQCNACPPPPPPDPDLTAQNTRLTTPNPSEGDTITFDTDIVNLQGTVSSPFDVQFWLDIGFNGTVEINLNTIDAISSMSSGQQQTVTSASWVAQAGNNAIQACADLPGNDISEADESNNCAPWIVFTVDPPLTQCNDGIDNDGDGVIDFPADPSCSGPTDDDETNPPQCSDGVDNTDPEDSVSDASDPGCQSGVGGSHDPNDNDETDPPAPPPQCSDGIDNDGNGSIDHPADPGCSSPSDDDESSPPPNVDIEAEPNPIPRGTSSTITWMAEFVTGCSVFGPSGLFGTGTSSSQSSGTLSEESTFTLVCDAADGSGQSADIEVVKILPFSEDEI